MFLTATVVAALFAGLTAASGSRYLAWMDERARRLEIERDQQATIAAAAERTRIARELHDIVFDSLSVVITLADAAALVYLGPIRARVPMRWPKSPRSAATPSRTCAPCSACCGPTTRRPASPPCLRSLASVGSSARMERIRATGLDVSLSVDGTPFPLGAAAELTAYRIVQEALTNTLRHAAARRAWVTISYDEPEVRIRVADAGIPDGPRAVRATVSTACANEPPCTAVRYTRARLRTAGGWSRRSSGPPPWTLCPYEHLRAARR